jgi:hypothetical protein
MSPAGATLAEAGQGRLGVSQVPTDAHLTKAVVDFCFETFSYRYSTDHAAVLPSTVAIHTTVGCSPSSRSPPPEQTLLPGLGRLHAGDEPLK